MFADAAGSPPSFCPQSEHGRRGYGMRARSRMDGHLAQRRPRRLVVLEAKANVKTCVCTGYCTKVGLPGHLRIQYLAHPTLVRKFLEHHPLTFITLSASALVAGRLVARLPSVMLTDEECKRYVRLTIGVICERASTCRCVITGQNRDTGVRPAPRRPAREANGTKRKSPPPALRNMSYV